MKNILVAICVATIFFSIYSDEVKSFSSEEEQRKYLSELVDKIPAAPPVMSEAEARQKLKMQEEVTAWAEAIGRRGRFVIAGKVVDGQGNLMENVSVNIQKNASGFWKSKNTFKDYNISSFFVIYTIDCNRIHLTFQKNGYISSVKTYTYSYPLRSKSQSDNNITQTNGIIVAQQDVQFLKQDKILKLKKAETTLDFSAEKDENEIFLLKSWEKSWGNKQIREPYLQVKYMRDKNGRILKKEFKGMSGSRMIPVDCKLELVGGNKGDGIIAMNPTGQIVFYHFFNTMGKAPENGYVKEIDLPFKLTLYNKMFYYRVDNKYGKGVFAPQDGELLLYQNEERELSQKRNLWTKE